MDNQNIDALIQMYLFHCEFQKGLSSKTLKAYKTDLAQYAMFIKNTRGTCEKEKIQTYLSLLYKKLQIKSVKRKMAALKAFYGYLEYEEIVDINPFSKLRIKLHEPFLLPKTIPFATVDALLQCAYRQKVASEKTSYQYRSVLRDIAILELLFATGMRVSELCSLRMDSINLEEGTIKIYGKGAKERMIQVGNNGVLTAISEYYQAFSCWILNTGWFFINRLGNKLSDQSVRLVINKYTKLAGVSFHITPHMFRHSFATLLLEEDVDIRYIQQLLGHSSITTTQIYTHVTAKKQRDLLIAKHPRNKISV